MNDEQPVELEDIVLSYLKAIDSGQTPDPDEWLARFPQFADDLSAFFACERKIERVGPISTPHAAFETNETRNGEAPRLDGPISAGRFELGKELGRGGIGVVVRAHDPV